MLHSGLMRNQEFKGTVCYVATLNYRYSIFGRRQIYIPEVQNLGRRLGTQAIQLSGVTNTQATYNTRKRRTPTSAVDKASVVLACHS